MSKRKFEPIITHVEILALAGRQIQSTILSLRAKVKELETEACTGEQQIMLSNLQKSAEQQIAYHMERLRAVETLYQLETGNELGLTCEL